MAGYTRQESFTTGDIIQSDDTNNEFDQILAAFSSSSGHKHDGTAAEGPVLPLIGDAGSSTPLNKVLIDSSNDFIEFFVDVSGTSTQQAFISDGAILPTTTNDINLGGASNAFKSLFLTTSIVSAGGIILDAGTAATGISYTDSGTELLRFHNSGSNVIVESKVSDKDIIFKGNDGGSVVTALTIDMSDAGRVIAGGNMTVTGDLTVSGDDFFMATNTAGHLLVGDGTNYTPVAVSGDATLAASGAVAIAADAVTYAKMQNLATANRVLGSTSTGLIGETQIVAAMMAANSVDSDQYVDGSIDNSHLANDAVGADELASNAVVTASIVDNNVTQAKIADDAIGADQLAANAVVTASIVDSNITTAKIAGDAVTQAKIADDAVGADQLAASAVVTTSIVDSNITTAKIADDAVTYAKMQHTATANRLLGAASAGAIGETQVVSAMMAANSVDSASYVDGSIDPEHLADNAVTLAKMASGTDGSIISYDASQNPVLVAPGNDGQVLTSAGAGAQPAFETLPVGGGGGWLGEGTSSPEGNSGDIIRINQQTLNNSVTMVATDNGSATGPLAIASGVTVTISSGATFKVL